MTYPWIEPGQSGGGSGTIADGSITPAKLSFTPVKAGQVALNVDDYGAVGGDGADDGAAFQAAADAASAAGGGTVMCSAGKVYTIAGWIGANSNTPGHYWLRLKNNVTLELNGATIKLAAGAGPGAGGLGTIVGNDQSANGSHDIIVRNGTIDLSAGNVDALIAGVMFGNMISGGQAVDHGKIENVTVLGCSFIGVSMRDGPTNFEISGCHVDAQGRGASSQGSYGVQCGGSAAAIAKNGKISRNTVRNVTNNAVDLAGMGATASGPTRMTRVKVSGNTIDGCLDGIFLETVDHCTAVDNTITGATQWGIVVNRADAGDPVGNVINDNSIQAAQKGIYLSNVIYDTDVVGNNILLTANGGAGIHAYFSFGGAIAGNYIHGNGSADGGTGLLFTNGTDEYNVTGNTFSNVQTTTALGTPTATQVVGNAAYNCGTAAPANVLTQTLTIGGSSPVFATGGGKETIVTANTGSAYTANIANGNLFDLTLNAAAPTITLSGATSGVLCSVGFILRQDATGGRTPTFSPAPKWIGVDPSYTATASKIAGRVTLETVDGGTTWLGYWGGGEQ